MAWRVAEDDVKTLIDGDDKISFAPFITAANALTDHVNSEDSEGCLTTALLFEIERHLAAHFYEKRDQQYKSRRTADASAEFQGQWGKRLDRTSWGQDAIMFDCSGTLAKINEGKKKPSIQWVGLAPSEQTDYEDRD